MHADRRRTRGELGEQIAERHLERRGYRVVERNFRTRYGEIDLIAVDPRAIVFCEVKTRVFYGPARPGAGPAGPLDAIGVGKRKRVRMMATQWLAAREDGHARPRRAELRFDAIGVTLARDGRLLALDHVEAAF
jgi:putative endonuclease